MSPFQGWFIPFIHSQGVALRYFISGFQPCFSELNSPAALKGTVLPAKSVQSGYPSPLLKER
jgi:hypothetical protein